MVGEEGELVVTAPLPSMPVGILGDSDGSRYPTRAVYVEITEPERIVWTEPDSGMTTTSTFRDLDGQRTELHIRQANAPREYHSPEARAGFATSLDRFGAYLDKLGGSQ